MKHLSRRCWTVTGLSFLTFRRISRGLVFPRRRFCRKRKVPGPGCQSDTSWSYLLRRVSDRHSKTSARYLTEYPPRHLPSYSVNYRARDPIEHSPSTRLSEHAYSHSIRLPKTDPSSSTHTINQASTNNVSCTKHQHLAFCANATFQDYCEARCQSIRTRNRSQVHVANLNRRYNLTR